MLKIEMSHNSKLQTIEECAFFFGHQIFKYIFAKMSK